MAVYMFKAGILGDVKIGHSGGVRQRRSTLQAETPFRLWIMRVFQGARPEEAILHAKFSAQRVKGEWFQYSEDMESDDFGLVELPAPEITRRGAFGGPSGGRPTQAFQREFHLHNDVLALAGGLNALARRIGVPPWDVGDEHRIKPEYWPAAVMAARDVGRIDVSLSLLQAFREASNAATRAREAEIKASELRKAANYRSHRDKLWIQENGGTEKWWDDSAAHHPFLIRAANDSEAA